MSTVKQVLMYDIDNEIPEYVLWYFQKFGIGVKPGEVLKHDDSLNIDYCQGEFEFKRRKLNIRKQVLKQGTEQEELCWRILDLDTVEKKDDKVISEKIGSGVIIRKNKIAFRLRNYYDPDVYSSWRIVLKKIDCGVAFEFSSIISEITGELRITYDDSTGNITICLLFGDEINKVVADKKKKNEVIIPFDKPHGKAKDYVKQISDGFIDEEYVEQAADIIPQIEKDAELDLIKAMLEEPRVTRAVEEMIEAIPDILRRKEKQKLDGEYHWENCASLEEVIKLHSRYIREYKASMGLLEQRIAFYNSGAEKMPYNGKK